MLDLGSAVAAGLLELAFPIVVALFIDRLLPAGQIGLIALAALGLVVIYAASATLLVIVNYYCRRPRSRFMRSWTEDDEQAVMRAMEAAAVTELSGRLTPTPYFWSIGYITKVTAHPAQWA